MGGGVGTNEEFPKAESQVLLHCLVGGASHGPLWVTLQDLLKDQRKLRSSNKRGLGGALAPILECETVLRRGSAKRVIPE